MALEDILKKIKEKNQKDIWHIKKNAREQCKTIEQEIMKEVAELKAKNIQEVKVSTKKLTEYMLQDARVRKAKDILKTKSDILDAVFNEALKKLENLPTKEYMKWIERMALQVIEPGENKIVLPKQFSKMVALEEFLKQINEKLQDKSSIKIAEDKEEITGGFVLKKPKKEMNCSFKSLIEEKRNDLKVKISRILFGNDIS